MSDAPIAPTASSTPDEEPGPRAGAQAAPGAPPADDPISNATAPENVATSAPVAPPGEGGSATRTRVSAGASNGAAPTPGWFGKIPALGDFITRRLPPAFTAPWDDWLGRGMLQARQQLGAQFDDLYLTFPIWRFVLPPGQFGAQGWCGVLSPSVDRVGRMFPLTIALALPAPPGRPPIHEMEACLAGLAEVAMMALDEASPDAIDAALRQCVLPWSLLKAAPGAVPAAVPPAASATALATAASASASALASASAPASASAAAPALASTATAACAAVGVGASPGLPVLDFALASSFAAGAAWSLSEELTLTLHAAAERWLADALDRHGLWWTPAVAGSPGSARLETVPLHDGLLSVLINA